MAIFDRANSTMLQINDNQKNIEDLKHTQKNSGNNIKTYTYESSLVFSLVTNERRIYQCKYTFVRPSTSLVEASASSAGGIGSSSNFFIADYNSIFDEDVRSFLFIVSTQTYLTNSELSFYVKSTTDGTLSIVRIL